MIMWNQKHGELAIYDIEKPLPREKSEKVVGLIKDKLDGKVMTELAVLRRKKYGYLIDVNDENNRSQDTKKCVINVSLIVINIV